MSVAKVAYDHAESQALAADDYWVQTDGEVATTADSNSWHEKDPFFPSTFYSYFANDTTGTTVVTIEESENKVDVRKSTVLTESDAGTDFGTQYPYFRIKITVGTDATNVAYLALAGNRSGR